MVKKTFLKCNRKNKWQNNEKMFLIRLYSLIILRLGYIRLLNFIIYYNTKKSFSFFSHFFKSSIPHLVTFCPSFLHNAKDSIVHVIVKKIKHFSIYFWIVVKMWKRQHSAFSEKKRLYANFPSGENVPCSMFYQSIINNLHF